VKIIDYKLIGASTVDSLAAKVNEFIKDGWVPLGGVAYGPETDACRVWYVQAMVKYEEQPK
jgi:hypothetical protein